MTAFDKDVANENLGDEERWRLASIVEGSQDAIISKTLGGIVTSWNRAAEEMFGYSADDMIGRPIAILFPPDQMAQEEEILARVRRGERVQHYDAVRLRKDGSQIHLSLSVSPIYDSVGRIVGASKIARDIGEQKLVRARLDELQKQLLHVARLQEMGQMASAFAHELNQPLSAVGNYLSGVRKLIEAGDSARALEGIDRANAQVVRAGEVIRRPRDFVKKGAGRRRTESLAQLVEESSELALVGARSDGVEVRLDLSAHAQTAVMDRIQVQQVLVNLVRNAVEAMADAPRRQLTITSGQPQPGWVEVAVCDTGPGLPESIKATLFQPFITTKETGMGVGLSLCRTIIEDHGGQIWAEDNPAGGAVFRFTLPCA